MDSNDFATERSSQDYYDLQERAWSDADDDYGSNWYDEGSSGPNWAELLVGGALTVAGLYLIYRGVSSQGSSSRGSAQLGRAGSAQRKGVEVHETVTVDKPAAELYRYWRELSNLPQIMRHLKTVEELDERRSHWVAKGPLNTSVEWDAEITEDIPNSRIAWRAVEDAQVPNEGSVRFQEAAGGRGTEIHVQLSYRPPLGPVGAAIAKLFGREPSQQIGEDLKRFKQRMETGEIATTDGQSSGRMG